MMRAVVDTNVLVSAAILPQSRPGSILFHIHRQTFLPLYHSKTLTELVRVLGSNRIQKRFRVTPGDIALIVELIVRHGELVTPTERITVCRDSNDDIFLEIACAGKADVLVTGDADLLALHPFRGIPIIKPAEFLDLFGEQ